MRKEIQNAVKAMALTTFSSNPGLHDKIQRGKLKEYMSAILA